VRWLLPRPRKNIKQLNLEFISRISQFMPHTLIYLTYHTPRSGAGAAQHFAHDLSSCHARHDRRSAHVDPPFPDAHPLNMRAAEWRGSVHTSDLHGDESAAEQRGQRQRRGVGLVVIAR
jgi:hypothetical protein